MSRKLALVIGNSEYEDATLAGLLRDPATGGFDQVDILLNRPFADVHPAIADFFNDKRPDDLLLLYFSGHGVLDAQGRLFLGLKNTRRTLLSGTAIASGLVKEQMDDSRSRRQVLILDCCHSGAFARGAKGALGAQAITDATFEGHGHVVLTATDITQYAWEGDHVIGQTENSLFTHYMIEGLKSGAADTDDDGWITPDELYEYVFGRMVPTTSQQRPRKIVYDMQGEMVIARHPRPVIKPAELPVELKGLLESPISGARLAAVRELENLLTGSVPGLVLAAHAALTTLKDDDSRRVSQAASEALARYEAQPATREAAPLALGKTEEERLARERAEPERRAKEKAAQLAAQKTEAEGSAREKAKQEAVTRDRVELERLVHAATHTQKTRLPLPLMGGLAVGSIVVAALLIGAGSVLWQMIAGPTPTLAPSPTQTQAPLPTQGVSPSEAATSTAATQPHWPQRQQRHLFRPAALTAWALNGAIPSPCCTPGHRRRYA